MRDINQMTVTDAVKASFKERKDERGAFLLDKFLEHLHDFTREVNLTQQEWLGVLNFLYDCGQISNPQRHEFILLSDVIGWSALVDMINTKGGGTEMSNLGPFYLEKAPEMKLGAHLAKDREGVIVLVSGVVKDTLGNLIPGAELDTWQADGAGNYPVQDSAQDPFDLRARFTTDEQGRYYYTTVLPKNYTVPYDGPVGKLLRAFGRHAWRAKHFHYILRAEGMRPIITELFFEGDEYIDADAVFGVRKSLIGKIERVTNGSKLEFPLERAPDARVTYDFVLAPAG